MRARLALCAVAAVLLPGMLNLAQDAPEVEPKDDWTDSDAGREFVLQPDARSKPDAKSPAKVILALEGEFLRAEFQVSAAMGAGANWIARKQRLRIALRASKEQYSLEYYPFCDSGVGAEEMERCRVAKPENVAKDKYLHGGVATVVSPELWRAVVWIDLKAIGIGPKEYVQLGLAWGCAESLNEVWACWPKPDKNLRLDDSVPQLTRTPLSTLKQLGKPDVSPVLTARALEQQLLAYYIAAGAALQRGDRQAALQVMDTALASFPADPALAHAAYSVATSALPFGESPIVPLRYLQQLARFAPGEADFHAQLMLQATMQDQIDIAVAAWRIAAPLTCWSSKPDARNLVECAAAQALAAAGLFEECLALMPALAIRALDAHASNPLKATVEQALMAGSFPTAQSLFKAWLGKTLNRDLNPDIHNRLWWASLLSECGYGTEALAEVESQLAQDVPGHHATELVGFAIRAANEGLDPPEAAARLRALADSAHASLAQKRREELRARADELDKHAQDWQAELAARKQDSNKTNPRITFTTRRGDIVFELFEDQAPNTVANFVQLVSEDHYTGRSFYRYEPDWLIQGGSIDNTPIRLEKWAIANEDNVRQHWRGTLAMARTNARDSASTHFFISTSNSNKTLGLGTDWVVFGRVVQGMDVLQRLRKDDRIKSAKAENLRDHPYRATRLPKQ